MHTHVTHLSYIAVFEVAGRLEKNGIGHRLQRTTWPKDSFWTITAIRPSLVSRTGSVKKHEYSRCKSLVMRLETALDVEISMCVQDGKHGKASGLFTWKGKSQHCNRY